MNMLWPVLLVILFGLLGAPLFAVMIALGCLGFYQVDIDFSVLAINIYQLTDSPLLLALPFFTFAGYLLSASQASQRFVELIQACTGNRRSIFAVVALVIAALFTAFTGASGVTIVALGAVLYPALLYAGYSEKFSLGLVTTSGSLGLLFPPSIPLILYAVMLQQMDLAVSVTVIDVFLAGLFPGLLMLISLSLYSFWINRHLPLARESFSGRRLAKALRAAIWELPLPLLVLIGIYGGYLALSEVAAVTALAVFIVEVFIYREISGKQLLETTKQALMTVGAILIIVAAATVLSNYLLDAEVPERFLTWIQQSLSSKVLFLMTLNIALLLIGAVLDIYAALFIIVPLILPVALSFGIHPAHLGIIFLANMQIGYLTPPVGMNLFIASLRFNKPILLIFQAVWPYLLILLFDLLLITYWPALSLFWLAD